MTIERIALTNYGSHVETDWSPNGARLVAIVGPNGAGKTTLAIDALMHVLWDQAHGESVDDVVRIGATESSVLVEFVFAGARYRAIRRRTTRAGGKTSADLQVQGPGGSWFPLASGAREVPAAIAALLRMDAQTFRTAVVLAQGEADRFLAATPGKGKPGEPGRAAILATIVVDPRYAVAERIARDRARDLEARTAVDRDAIVRLDARLTARPELEQQLAQWTATAAAQDEALASLRERRATRDALVRDLIALLASYEQAERDVAAVEARRDALQIRYSRTRERKRASEEALAAAQATVAGAPQVEVAVAELPGLQAELEALEATVVRVQELDREIVAKRDALRAAAAEHDQAAATWSMHYEAARRLVDELPGRIAGLPPVACEKCGHRNVVDQANLRGQLEAARKSFKLLEANRPVAPVGLAREEAAITRLRMNLERDQRATAGVSEMRGRVRELERRAARAEAIDAARATVTRETTAIADADLEFETVTAEGKAAAAELSEKRALAAKAEPIRSAKAAAERDLVDVDREVAETERERRATDGHVASFTASVADLDRVQVGRDETVAAIAGAEITLGRLRKIASAFGVKGIPARIIEGVLPEFAESANELLGQLHPGMSIAIRATRAKADGSGIVEEIHVRVRDAAGERSVGRLSGGEATSVSLAIAFALNRLAARRAGFAIRYLAIDEPDGLDAEHRRALAAAARLLAHRGDLDKVVIVTHTEDLAEAADSVFRVDKNGGGSVVSQVA